MAVADIKAMLDEYATIYAYILSVEPEIQAKLDKYQTRSDYEKINAEIYLSLTKLRKKMQTVDQLTKYMKGSRL